MSTPTELDALLIERIRQGVPDSWNELISRYEGRLLAFVDSRLHNRAAAEDIVQESFIGFLTSLPNFDTDRSLEGYLFSIAAHKLTDYLRREGRRPTLTLQHGDGKTDELNLPSLDRAASSIFRSRERQGLEEEAIVAALTEIFGRWQERGEWQKIQVNELLFVRGMPNKDVATELGISEQTVANLKFDFLAKLRTAVRKQGLPTEVFPELADGE